MSKLEEQKPPRGLIGLLTTLVRRQETEKPQDPVRKEFRAAKNQFIAQQDDFRTVVEETISRLDRARRG